MSGSATQRGRREFVIDTVIVAFTQLLIRARGLVLIPVIVKVLGTTAYGIWAQVVAFAAFVGALCSFSLHVPLVRTIAADRSRCSEVYVTSLVVTLAISGVVGGLIAASPGPFSELLLDAPEAAEFLQLGALLMVFSNVRILNTSLYRSTGRLVARSATEIIAVLGEIIGIVVIVVLPDAGSLRDVLWFMVIWNGAIALLQTAHCLAIAGLSPPRWKVAASALSYVWPLFPAAIATVALDRVDRFIIGNQLGADAVGIYSANYALAALVLTFQAPFQMTLMPKVAELWDRDRPEAARYINASTNVFLTLAIPFVLGIPILAGPVLNVLGNAEIAGAAGWMSLFIAAGATFWGVSVMYTQILHGARRPGVHGAVAVVGAIINIGLNVVLVPAVGIIGAAIATLVAYGVTCLTLAMVSRTILRIDFDHRHLLACLLAAGGMCGGVVVASPATGPELVGAAVAALAIYVALLALLRAVLPGARSLHDRRLTGILHLR